MSYYFDNYMLLTFNFKVSRNTVKFLSVLQYFSKKKKKPDKGGNRKPLSDAQGAALAVHNPTKTAIFH